MMSITRKPLLVILVIACLIMAILPVVRFSISRALPLTLMAEQQLARLQGQNDLFATLAVPILSAIHRYNSPFHVELKPKVHIMPLANGQSLLAVTCVIQTNEELLDSLENHPECVDTHILPGQYQLDQRRITIAAHSSGRLIQASGNVEVQLMGNEGLYIASPNISVQGLKLTGACRPTPCEHAFHVVGKAQHTRLSNNVLVNFTAAIKINGEGGAYPDHGIIDDSVIYNTEPMATKLPVTPIDLVAASHWKIRNNSLFDFHKSAGNRVSYGVFVKGGGEHSEISGNLIVCDAANRSLGSQIGLSVGGGGTGQAFMRQTDRQYEYSNTLIHHNIILNCNSDISVYFNKAAQVQFSNNLILGGAGIDVRYSESQVLFTHNLLSGRILSREQGHFVESQNQIHTANWLTMTSDTQSLLTSIPTFDFSSRKPLNSEPATLYPEGSLDFCGQPLQQASYMGVLSHSCPERFQRLFSQIATP